MLFISDRHNDELVPIQINVNTSRADSGVLKLYYRSKRVDTLAFLQSEYRQPVIRDNHPQEDRAKNFRYQIKVLVLSGFL